MLINSVPKKNIPQELTPRAIAWNSGFMFYEGFADSSRFARYCDKMDATIAAFIEEQGLTKLNGTSPSVVVAEATRDFFNTLFATEGMGAFLGKESMDWRFNLLPMMYAIPYNLKTARKEVAAAIHAQIKDDRLFYMIIPAVRRDAALHFLHTMFIRYEDVTEESFCICGLPRDASESMLYMKLYFNIAWIRFYEFAMDVVKQKDLRNGAILLPEQQKQMDRLTRTADKLSKKKDAVEAKAKADETVYKSRIAELEKQLRELETKQESIVRQSVRVCKKEYAEKLTDARRTAKNALKTLESARERIRALEEASRIEEDAAEDSAERAPDTTLEYTSKIVFIVSPPANGRVERTFEKLRQKFPNATFANKPDDIPVTAECCVFLTKYILHHALYHSARDLCNRRGYAYIHSAKQNPEIIAQDIFGRTRYMQGIRTDAATPQA